MAGCQIPVIDHTALGISRLATQYTESSNLIGFLSAFLAESDELEAAMQELVCDRTIDTATDTTLDLIGALVGQSRTVKAANTTTFFSFFGNFNGKGFTGNGQPPGTGGVWRGVSDPPFLTVTLTDADYRTFIRGRIIRNHTSGTIEEVITSLRAFLDPADTISITENYPASVDIVFNIGVDEQLLSILFLNDLIPRPICVNYILSVA